MKRQEYRDDESRIALWVRNYADPLRGYIWSISNDRSATEDILQEVFLRAWKARNEYTEAGCEKAYLFRIADRLVLDRWRKRTNPVQLASDAEPQASDSSADPLHTLMQHEDHQRLREAIQMLSEQQQRTLLLRYFGEFPFDEIAKILGCPRNTALSHVRRGIERLRSILVSEANT